MSSENGIKREKNVLIGERLKKARIYLKKGNQTNFAVELGINQATLSKYEKGTSEIPDEIKTVLGENGINLHWLITGKGDMLLESQEKVLKQEEKHPIVASLEAMINQRLEKIESKIAKMDKIESQITKIEDRLEKASKNDQDSAVFVSESEPEYLIKVLSVHSIAAGLPITQSDDLSAYRDVPRRLIKTRPEDYYAAHIIGESMTEAGIPDGCWVLIRISDMPRHNAIQVVRRGDKSTLKWMREGEDHRWTLLYDDNSGRRIEIEPEEDYQVQGDFVAVLPDV